MAPARKSGFSAMVSSWMEAWPPFEGGPIMDFTMPLFLCGPLCQPRQMLAEQE